VPSRLRARARLVAQAPGVVAGIGAARAVARRAGLSVRASVADGAPVRRGTVVLEVEGPARRLLAAERTMLNYLMHLSGIATATRRAVRAAGPGLRVLATRKTLPGLRDLEKAAVVTGGGGPHRRDLAEGVLVKSTHARLVGFDVAVARALARGPRAVPVAIEVRSASEAIRAARAGAVRLLIDNAGPARARRIIRSLAAAGLRAGRWIEVSGGIRPENVGRYRDVGADAASLGSLTHSARALPFHLVLVGPDGRRARRPR